MTTTSARMPHSRTLLPLQAVAALALAVLVGVAIARWADLTSAQQPDAAVVVQRALRFADQPDGTIRISDAASGATVATIAVGSDAFLRSAVRGLVRERRRQGIDATPPFQLLAHADGRLTLVDAGTGRRIDLESFGATNAAAFARLLPAPAASARLLPASRSTTP